MQRRSQLAARVGLCCCAAACILKGARAAAVTVPREAHGHVAYLSCSLGVIEIAGASYGGWVNSRRVALLTRAPITVCYRTLNGICCTRRNYAAAAAGGTCDNGGLPDCHCQCGVGHDNPPGAVVDVQAKVASVCNAQKACAFTVCWAVGGGPAECNKPGTVALGDPCVKCKKDFQVIYDCTWGWSFVLVVVLGGGLYAGGGWATNHRLKGLDGIDALPHVDMWREVINLARDGIRFAQARIKGRSGYVAVTEHSSGRVSADREVRDSPADRREDGGKRGKESKRSSKAGGKGGSVMKSRLLDAPSRASEATEGAAASVGAQAAVKSSPSAAGGRWVHVPT